MVGVGHGAAERPAVDATEDGEYLTVAGVNVNDNSARVAAPARPKKGIARRHDRKPSIYDRFGDDTTTAPISNNAPHIFSNGHVEISSVNTATPTSGVGPAGHGRRCAYVSGNDGLACQHAAGGSSKYFGGHTCTHPGCYSAKSSRVEYCAEHSGGTEA